MTTKDTNLAVRVPFAMWKELDHIRATRTIQTNKHHSISDIIREALDYYLGDTCQNKTDN